MDGNYKTVLGECVFQIIKMGAYRHEMTNEAGDVVGKVVLDANSEYRGPASIEEPTHVEAPRDASLSKAEQIYRCDSGVYVDMNIVLNVEEKFQK